MCGVLVTLQGGHKAANTRKRGRAYCSEEHKQQWVSEDARQRLLRRRDQVSARMRSENPMHDASTRAKVSATFIARRLSPIVRGGNGTGLTVPQVALAAALGWETEVVVPTETGQHPHHYKLDVANVLLKVCVEIDGPSHSTLKRQASDKRKDNVLRGKGWTVLRFSNQEVTDDLEGCVRMVLSTISKLKATTLT